MGVVYLLSMLTTMSVFVTSTVSMFGIALAIDYSLFVLMRFRRNYGPGATPPRRPTPPWEPRAWPWCCQGLTVIASLTGIYLIGTPVLRSMATGTILAVAFAVLTSTTLTPSVLSVFGRARPAGHRC